MPDPRSLMPGSPFCADTAHDMALAAEHCLRAEGRCEAAMLLAYGFTCDEVLAFSTAAIRSAKARVGDAFCETAA